MGDQRKIEVTLNNRVRIIDAFQSGDTLELDGAAVRVVGFDETEIRQEDGSIRVRTLATIEEV